MDTSLGLLAGFLIGLMTAVYFFHSRRQTKEISAPPTPEIVAQAHVGYWFVDLQGTLWSLHAYGIPPYASNGYREAAENVINRKPWSDESWFTEREALAGYKQYLLGKKAGGERAARIAASIPERTL